MRFMVSLAAAAASFALVWQSCDAQDAAKLYKAHKEASAKIKTLSYSAEIGSAKSGGPAGIKPMSGKIVMTTDLTERLDFRGKFHIVGQAKPKTGQTNAFEIGFDGKVIRNVVHSGKLVEEMKVPEGDEPIAFFEPSMMLLAFGYWHDEDEDQEPSAIKLEGQAEVGGVKCDILIVERTFEMPSMDEEPDDEPAKKDDKTPDKKEVEKKDEPKQVVMKTRMHIAQDDHLVRKLEYTERPGADTFTFAITFTEVKPNPSLETTAFDVKVPDGYKIEERIVENEEPEPKFKVGDIAADWTLSDADGKEHKLSEFRGKVVVMDFWATWCGPCKMAMPGLQKLHEKYKDKPVVIVGVNVHDDSDAAKKYISKKKFTYLSLLAGDAVADAYGVGPIPQFFVIGVDGKVIHHALGFDPRNEEKLAEVIDKHLKEHAQK